MQAAPGRSAEDLDLISAEIFDLLWGHELRGLPTAVDHAYQMIWRQLVGGGRRSGERVQDTELATQLGLSRTPVRQALHRLAQDGLVRFDPRRGFSVREFTARDIQEIFDVRCALEVLALRLAAPQLQRQELRAELEELYTVRSRLSENPVALYLQNDLRLHNMIIRASGNRSLIRILATLRSQHGLFQLRDTFYPGRMEVSLDDHERILLALIEGRFEQGADLLAEHITNARNGILADIYGVKEVVPLPVESPDLSLSAGGRASESGAPGNGPSAP